MAPVIATLCSAPAINDLKVLLFTLQLWNDPAPSVHIVCDSPVAIAIPAIGYRGNIHTHVILDKYIGSRIEMEKRPGLSYKTEWEDFMMEKCTAIDHAFGDPAAQNNGVLFCDADITFFAQLPNYSENVADLVVTPHYIKPADEKKFGIYNAGYVWTRNASMPQLWREAAKKSRYYDQAALEQVVAKNEKVTETGVETNYGWWRMYQSSRPYAVMQNEWSYNRLSSQSGITIGTKPLLSVHTHWNDFDPTSITNSFNRFVLDKIMTVKSLKKMTTLRQMLETLYPEIKKYNATLQFTRGN